MGFAFATYNNEADAKKDFEAVNGKDLNGKKLVVDYAFQRQKQEPKKDKSVEPAAKKAKGEQCVVEKKNEVAKKEEKKNGSAVKEANNNKRKIDIVEDEDDEDGNETKEENNSFIFNNKVESIKKAINELEAKSQSTASRLLDEFKEQLIILIILMIGLIKSGF